MSGGNAKSRTRIRQPLSVENTNASLGASLHSGGSTATHWQMDHRCPRMQQAARYLGTSESILRLWRSRGEGPRHFKAGTKLVRYLRRDLDFWIESRLSEPGTSAVKAEQASAANDGPSITTPRFAAAIPGLI